MLCRLTMLCHAMLHVHAHAAGRGRLLDKRSVLRGRGGRVAHDAGAHTSTGAVIRFVVVDTGLYLSLGAERRALRLIQFSTIWGSKLQNQFNLIWYGLTRFTKVNGLI